MSKIAFLGLGAMGGRMAINLIDAGYELTVWNRSPEPLQALRDRGAHIAETPAAALQQADLAISMLTDDHAVRAVWLDGPSAAINGLRPGMIAIESSSTSPGWCRELEQAVVRQGAHFTAAPVVGSRPQAEAGQLIYLVGGENSLLPRIEPVLAVNAAQVFHLGSAAIAMAAKLAVNGWFATQVGALAEILGLLDRAGLESSRAADLIAALPVTSPGLAAVGRLITTDRYEPLFPVDLVIKDLGYLARMAADLDAGIPLSATASREYARTSERGFGGENIHAIAHLYV